MDRAPVPSPPLLGRPLVRAGIAAILLAALLAAFFAVRASRDDNSGGEEVAARTPASTPGNELTSDPSLGPLDDGPPIVGQPAPDFALRSTDGDVVRLSDLRDRVVLINFWATWCGPCKRELPVMQRIYDEKREAGLVVLAVNQEESADQARAFFAERGLDMTVVLDRNADVFDQYRLSGLPDSFFVDRDGNLSAIYYGEINEEKIRDRLAAAGLP